MLRCCGLCSSCGKRGLRCGGFSCFGAWALGREGLRCCGSRALEPWLNSCGAQTCSFCKRVGSSQIRDGSRVSCLARQTLCGWATREPRRTILGWQFGNRRERWRYLTFDVTAPFSCSNMCLTFCHPRAQKALPFCVPELPGREWKGQGWAKDCQGGVAQEPADPHLQSLLSQFLMLEITLSCLSSYSKKPIKCEVSYRSNTTMQTNFSWTIVGNLTPSHPPTPPSHFWSLE